MKKIKMLFVMGLLAKGLIAQNPISYYIDFGPSTGTTGDTVMNPDGFGHHWNNITNATYSALATPLFDKSKVQKGATLTLTTSFGLNGKDGFGGLTSLPDSNKLEDLGVVAATEDFFFTDSAGSMIFKGLNPQNKYIFSVFASRSNASTRISKYTFTGTNTVSGTLQTSGSNLGGAGINGNNSTMYITDSITPASDGSISMDISIAQGTFAYICALKISEYIGAPIVAVSGCTMDPKKIAFFGSSVANGVGASNNNGYRQQYSNYLNSLSEGWSEVNNCVSGDNTTNAKVRFYKNFNTSTGTGKCSRYIIIAYSMGNEGLSGSSNKQAVLNKFKNNLLNLIDSAKAYGMTPVIMNCYPREDYTASDYTYIKQMNNIIHTLNVPSANFLGAIDDLSGQCRWAAGYKSDAAHPNNAGHNEFYRCMVPSLFNALDAQKPFPEKVTGTEINIDSSSQIEFSPMNIHPFTFSFDIKTSSTGTIAAYTTADATGKLTIDSNRKLNYVLNESTKISGSTTLTSDQFHTVTLTHYYAAGKTFLYVDGALQGSCDEKIAPLKFVLASEKNADFSQLFFYRAGMNTDEIAAMKSGNFLQSSLEVYAPLDGKAKQLEDQLSNKALSLLTLSKTPHSLSSAKIQWSDEIKVFPNPVNNTLNIEGLNNMEQIEIRNVNGQTIKTFSGNTINLSELTPGIYFLKISNAGLNQYYRFVKE
ncbi:MAG: T9SS type A sorting domain-containing protein [Bacteroidetes bacterium]|nr:T9SS type A sorting domain-containing protein [Bacteroidota bacterium]